MGFLNPMTDETTISECAHALRNIANDIRSEGDIPLVLMDDNGVGPADITLADELWLIALRLDGAITTHRDGGGGTP